MMHIDDLRSELASRAEQMPPATSTAARMAAVRRRVRARRQRITGGVVSVALLGAGAVVLLPGVVDRDGSQVVEPAAPTQTPSGETVFQEQFDPGSWPTRIDGNTFLTGRVTEPGDNTARWTMTVPTLDVSLSVFCRVDEGDFSRGGREGYVTTLSINGESAFGTSCSPAETLASATGASDWARSLRSRGVRPDVPFTVEMSVKRHGSPAPGSQALQGLGVYAQDGEVRQVTPGWTLPVIRGTPGDESRLTELFTVPVVRSRTLGPVFTGPRTPVGSSVSYGWLAHGLRGTYQLLEDGEISYSGTAGGISSGVPVTGEHRLVVRARGGRTEGTLFLGVYEAIDPPYTGSARR